MSKKLTPWFDGSVKPVHVGRYLRNYHTAHSIECDLWDGSLWRYCDGTRAILQDRQWRGLAEQPK